MWWLRIPIYNTGTCGFGRETNINVSQLTAFVYIRRDVDGGGVIRDESLEVGVFLEVIGNISVPLFLHFLCLINLYKKGENIA